MKLALAIALFIPLLIAGAVSAETITITVHDYPSGDGPADRASVGVPFKPGALFDPVSLRLRDGPTEVPVAVGILALWHYDNSIRAVLLQFGATFAGASKDFELDIGTPRSMSDTVSAVAWDFPKKLTTLPADYLCASKVVWDQVPSGACSYPYWEQRQDDEFHNIDYDTSTLLPCASHDQYYNSIHSSYQLYARTGDKEYLINGRKWALHHQRDQIYLSGDSIGHGKCPMVDKTRYTYIQGLVDDYFLFGDVRSRDVGGIVADNFYMTYPDSLYYVAPGENFGFWSEREPAFPLIGLIAYYEATNNPVYLDKVHGRIDSLYKMQHDCGGTAWIHNLNSHDPTECYDIDSFGISPWMTGIMLEVMVKYHKLTGYNRAGQAIIYAVDHLKNCLATGAYAGESFPYMCGCTDPNYTNGYPDLSNHVSHGFAYAYKITGDTEYKDIAVLLLSNGMDHGWIGDSKHYNQQFRASGHAVAYLEQVAAAPTTTPEMDLALFENYPNPFNPHTTIGYTIPKSGQVLMNIYDARGRMVRTLVDETQNRGLHTAEWDGTDRYGVTVASGVYFVRLAADKRVKTRKILLLK